MQGGPVGVETLSAALSESRDAIEEVIEPYLLQQGLIQRTPRGRMLAAKAWAHLGMAAPDGPGQGSLALGAISQQKSLQNMRVFCKEMKNRGLGMVHGSRLR